MTWRKTVRRDSCGPGQPGMAGWQDGKWQMAWDGSFPLSSAQSLAAVALLWLISPHPSPLMQPPSRPVLAAAVAPGVPAQCPGACLYVLQYLAYREAGPRYDVRKDAHI